MNRILILASAIALIAVACGSSDETTTTAAIDDPTTSTTTTTVAQQTTTVAVETTTTTSAPPPVEAVAPTTAIGVLQAYSPGGGDLFPPGSVEAHWYQWDGLYVVLYRGFDAAAGNEICAGNSILLEGVGFSNVTNSPYLGEVDAICVGADSIANPPQGVYACGALLYYLTEIPIDVEGTLYGTLEIGTAAGFNGQTSQTASNTTVPEFEPGLEGYDLPPGDIDAGGAVSCNT